MEELKALEDRIVADGGTPWCHGLFAEGSTGFTGVDVMEDILLRRQPLEVYDKYITNEIKFDDPRIVAALEETGKILRSETKVAGGPTQVATLDWRVAAKGIFNNPPDCYMYHQGTYMPQFFPKGKKYGDWDFFYFPKPLNKPGFAKYPVNGGGAFFTITKDSPAAQLKESMPESTMIYVTHDQVEAMTLASRIVLLTPGGRIGQVGRPLELYTRPQNEFVAQFIGSPAMNLLPGEVVGTESRPPSNLRPAGLPSRLPRREARRKA